MCLRALWDARKNNKTEEWSFAFTEERLGNVSSDYTHASWQLRELVRLVRVRLFWTKKVNSAQSLCSKLFYCWIGFNKKKQPFRHVECSIWLAFQFDIPNCLVLKSLSPLWVSRIQKVFRQYKTAAFTTCSVLGVRQCEQHCVCALRFRKWEFETVIDSAITCRGKHRKPITCP